VVLLVSRSNIPPFDGVMLSCAIVCGAVCLRLVLGQIARESGSFSTTDGAGNAHLRGVRVRD
jgi:hypothetical protein